MKAALCMAVVILVFLLLRPLIIEGYDDSKAVKEYKDTLLAKVRIIANGKPIDEKSSPDVMIKVMDAWLEEYNKYANKTGAPMAKLDDATKMFPEVWMEEYNKSVAKK
jgi:hypothetical protein